MNKPHFIKLTLAVYRVTDLFPEGEPLKFKIRELSNDILADLILASAINQGKDFEDKQRSLSRMEIMDGYLDLAQAHDWADHRNYLVLRTEYSKIKEWLDSTFQNKVQKVENPNIKETMPSNNSVNEIMINGGRRAKIIEHLEGNGRVQIGQLSQIFPDISRRTLVRDLDGLFRSGYIRRIGNGRAAYYDLIRLGQNKTIET